MSELSILIPEINSQIIYYFEDIEGNILEVAYNSFIPMDEHNNAIGHMQIGHL